MLSPASEVRDLLVAASLVQEASGTDWFVSVSKLRDTPDKHVAIYDYGGASPGVKWNIDNPSVQVRVRTGANDYDGGYAKCLAIKNALLGFESADVNGERWVSVSMTSDINFLHRDSQDRPEWTLNFEILKLADLPGGAAREEL